MLSNIWGCMHSRRDMNFAFPKKGAVKRNAEPPLRRGMTAEGATVLPDAALIGANIGRLYPHPAKIEVRFLKSVADLI